MRLPMLAVVLGVWFAVAARADDGYRLWLRYDRITDEKLVRDYARELSKIQLLVPGGRESSTLAAVREELAAGMNGLLGISAPVTVVPSPPLPALGTEGYSIEFGSDPAAPLAAGTSFTAIRANTEVGLLYGAFALLREMVARQPILHWTGSSAPRIRLRMLNHWDNLNGSVERGYAGASLWEWEKLPAEISPRYRDYARANASIGINATVLTNVNANARILRADYLAKVAALADVFRPYGIKVYLTARFSAPIEAGGLKTADPLDPGVIRWWADKVDEIYRVVPDFGGFLVKANSEGQPGPQSYQRTHADGANVLADAVAPHGGIVIWRAFVYDDKVADDRHKQAYNEFVPLDGKFRDNVVVQVKNGAIDFMPREPFHPLFGAMPRTPLALELQITQEYNGGSTELDFLAPMWSEVLNADTHRPAAGSTVARVIEGGSDQHRLSVIAGVANTGSDRNWCGNQLAPANWYAFGRLAWNPGLAPETIAEEWTRQTFGSESRVVRPILGALLASREAVVNYSMPLGLHHIMANGHHQGPGPWYAAGNRPDWMSTYYHKADVQGLGFDRTETGSKAVDQYAPEVAKRWSDLATCPDEYLLWFHHLPWSHRMRSGRTLWDELCLRYQKGVETVRGWEREWETLAGAIDEERFKQVQALLRGQEREACIWRDGCTQYFATFSLQPLPPGVEAPKYLLADLRRLRAPFTATPKEPVMEKKSGP